MATNWAPLVAVLFLFCYERDFMVSLSDDKQADIFDDFNTTNRYEGGSICNENPFITPSTNALGVNAICQTKDQSVAVIMVHKTLF